MSISIQNIINKQDLEKAFEIRKIVFVEEQKVEPEEEYDEFEETSRHFLAIVDQKPVGTARWRFTEKGVKLERFAVLSEARNQGVGQQLVQAVLNDVQNDSNTHSKMIYLHAQLSAVGLYQKFNFQAVGDIFEEANIKHYKMIFQK
ncbi:MAG: GNAT family N-acetyltransferase [Bacteroidetes bacterium]|nr:MAG: GNAT family N-acetyltransferase [Bacteroidota bacterium]TAG89648.1 MAG: GNAT family N-acetyltransferase [Bacteroidota bacterium]